MTRQTFTRSTSVFLGTALISGLLLSGCVSLDFNDADPEKYMGYDCEQLEQLAESYRPMTQDLLLEDDISERERMNERNNRLGVRDDARPYEIEQDRERRSITQARRQKGCI